MQAPTTTRRPISGVMAPRQRPKLKSDTPAAAAAPIPSATEEISVSDKNVDGDVYVDCFAASSAWVVAANS